MRRALSMGMAVHHQLIRSNHDADSFLCNLLVQMYGKCGALDEANCVLARIPQRDVFTWTFIISAYSRSLKGCDPLKEKGGAATGERRGGKSKRSFLGNFLIERMAYIEGKRREAIGIGNR
ncbi:hypothetical protein KP509_19G062800 [Ceratopteris richardii]|uniref:Pentatricopeptide repeat-containing protein n=1 Tax=Ceratopteris richardii TaxID=49495 RepID=A0A8T2SQ35_CERRI|nr:hypothetical protein KP509_19G062800 [Ceratopteris richardii]